nr:hypothetical protein [Tanacetum cinerariifolium]
GRYTKSLAKEADDSLAKHKALELEIEHFLRAVENEYTKLWNDWYKKCDECKFDKISYDKAYKDMQQKFERLQAQLGDLKGKSKDTSGVSDILNPLSHKLENENVELEFQVDETHALSKPATSKSVPTPQESKVMKNDKVIASGMFRINSLKTSREEKHVANIIKASARTKPITVSQPLAITKKDVNSDSNGFSSTRIDNTKTRRPQLRSNTKNDRKQKANVSIKEKQKKHQPKVKKPKKVGFIERLATPKPNKPRFLLKWSPTGRLFDQKGKLVNSSESNSQSDCSNGNLKLLINFVWKFMGTVRFGNDHVATILGFGDLQWRNILITRVYFVEGLGHNLFSVRQLCDSDLEVAFRRNACFVKNLEGVDLLKGDRSTNLYTIYLYEMAFASQSVSWLVLLPLSHGYSINEHLCPSCEQGKSKRASHPPKPVPSLRQRLHLLHMDLCGPMRIADINGKR